MRKVIKTMELSCDACGCILNTYDKEMWMCYINDVHVELCGPCVEHVKEWAQFLNKYTDKHTRFYVDRKYDVWKDGAGCEAAVSAETLGHVIGLLESFMATGHRSDITEAIARLTVA